MGTWKTRGLRGSTLEELINRTNEKYLEGGLALIQKIPTPITPINIDKENRQTQEKFRCTKCGFELNADHNASINIARSEDFIK